MIWGETSGGKQSNNMTRKGWLFLSKYTCLPLPYAQLAESDLPSYHINF